MAVIQSRQLHISFTRNQLHKQRYFDINVSIILTLQN